MHSGLVRWVRRAAAHPLTLYFILSAVLLILLVHGLSTRPGGFSPAEVTAKSDSQGLQHIKNNPVNAPHNLLAYGLHSANLSWRAALRLSSAVAALAFIFSFYIVVKAWFGRSVGLMGTVIFATTPLFLVSARQGSAEIMFFSLISIIAGFLWLVRCKDKDIGIVVMAVLCALFIYTPGIIWWLVAAIILSRKKLSAIMEEASPPAKAASLLLGLLILIPLGIAIAKDLSLIKQLALIPSHFATPLESLKHLVWMISGVFIKAPYHNNLILGRMPVLDVIEIGLLFFGCWALYYAARFKLALQIMTISFAIVAAAVNDNYALLALGLPALAIIISAGLRFLFIEWRSVFPKNPLARSLALSLMWILVLVNVVFGIRYAVIAWPDSVETKSVYVLK